MNVPLHPALLLIGFVALTFSAVGQGSKIPAASQAIGRTLESKEIQIGQRSIRYDRVATPILEPPTPSPAIRPTPPLTPELAERLQREVTVNLSATVYDGETTLVRWDFDGVPVAVWSSINFHHLLGVRHIPAPDKDYWVRLRVYDSSREEAEALNAILRTEGWPTQFFTPVPVPLARPAPRFGESTYAPLSGTSVPPEAAAALDALHQFYDANRARLTSAFEAAQTQLAERQAEFAVPSPPGDVTVTYFPIRSRLAPEPAAKEAR